MIATIGNESRLSIFYEREFITLQPESLWLIKRGAVKTLTWNETGAISILGYWGAGDVIGLPLSKVEPYEAKCLTCVEAVYIPWHQGNHLVEAISRCMQQTEELLRIVRIDTVYQRTYQLLVWLAQKFGRQVVQGTLIDIRLTHQELADIIGSTRVTVTRVLNQLETAKVIFRPKRFSIIVSG
ncbi:MAG TPA: Crp/Fnr family transcriptional regulator [Xenococcaceae cyanobacterium]